MGLSAAHRSDLVEDRLRDSAYVDGRIVTALDGAEIATVIAMPQGSGRVPAPGPGGSSRPAARAHSRGRPADLRALLAAQPRSGPDGLPSGGGLGRADGRPADRPGGRGNGLGGQPAHRLRRRRGAGRGRAPGVVGRAGPAPAAAGRGRPHDLLAAGDGAAGRSRAVSTSSGSGCRWRRTRWSRRCSRVVVPGSPLDAVLPTRRGPGGRARGADARHPVDGAVARAGWTSSGSRRGWRRRWAATPSWTSASPTAR